MIQNLVSIIAASRRRVTVDPDAADYFARIAAAGSSISEPNKVAVNAFVAGCKVDGIWAAIKASCLLAGPDDLTGALVPLVGAAPTNVGGLFVSGDYNRTTGLIGDASTKYLDANRAGNADPQNNQHAAVYATSAPTGNTALFGAGTTASGSTNFVRISDSTIGTRSQNNTQLFTTATILNLCGVSREISSEYVARVNSTSSVKTQTSQSPISSSFNIFARTGGNLRTNARLSFYSIGESLDLALLDARLATYMSALT